MVRCVPGRTGSREGSRLAPRLTLVSSEGWDSGESELAVLTPEADAGPPERNFPLPVVIAHGAFAAVTITLVLLTALGVGGS